MFTKSKTETMLDAEIQSALDKLGKIQDKTSKEYGTLTEHIAKLHKTKTEDRPKPRVSADTVLVVAANIFGILWLARYERENVIKAPRAFGSIMKPR